MYACQLSLLQLLIWASSRHWTDCLRLFIANVYDVLSYMCLPVFLSLVLRPL